MARSAYAFLALLALSSCERSFLHNITRPAAATSNGGLSVSIDSVSPGLAGVGTTVTVMATVTRPVQSCVVSIIQASASCEVTGLSCHCEVVVPSSVADNKVTVTVTAKVDELSAQASASLDIDRTPPQLQVSTFTIVRKPPGQNDEITGTPVADAVEYAFYDAPDASEPFLVTTSLPLILLGTEQASHAHIWITAKDSAGNTTPRLEIVSGADDTPPSVDRSALTFHSFGTGTPDHLSAEANAFGDAVFIEIDGVRRAPANDFDLGDGLRDVPNLTATDKCGNTSAPTTPRHLTYAFVPGLPHTQRGSALYFPRLAVSRAKNKTRTDLYYFGGSIHGQLLEQMQGAGDNQLQTIAHSSGPRAVETWSNITNATTPAGSDVHAAASVGWTDPASGFPMLVNEEGIWILGSSDQWSKTDLPAPPRGDGGVFDNARGVVLWYVDDCLHPRLLEFDGTRWIEKSQPLVRQWLPGMVYNNRRETTMFAAGQTCSDSGVEKATYVYDGISWQNGPPLTDLLSGGSLIYNAKTNDTLLLGGASNLVAAGCQVGVPCLVDSKTVYRLGDGATQWTSLDLVGATTPPQSSFMIAKYEPMLGSNLAFAGIQMTWVPGGDYSLALASGFYYGLSSADYVIWSAGVSGPSARWASAVMVDTERDRIVLQGGYDEALPTHVVAETWAYETEHDFDLTYVPMHAIDVELPTSVLPISGVLHWSGGATGGAKIYALRPTNSLNANNVYNATLGAPVDGQYVIGNYDVAITSDNLTQGIDSGRLTLAVLPANNPAAGADLEVVSDYLTLDLVVDNP